MWPFNNSLKEQLKKQDALEKYRRWLRKWLLGGAKLYALGVLVILAGVFLALKLAVFAPAQPAVNKDNNAKPSVTEEVITEPADSPAPKEQPIDVSQLVMPVNGEILVDFNMPYYSETYQDYRFNSGVTLNAEGQIIKAALPGKIIAAELDPYSGFSVVIDHGQGYQTQYTGLKNIQVAADQQVEKGDILGSGESTVNFILTHNGQPIDPNNQ